MDGFRAFEERRGELLEMINRLRPVLDGINVQETVTKLDVVHGRVESDTFKVMIVGEFNRGKSTVINALLGERVLPSYAQPCTAIINEVKWGEERRARLHPMPVNGQDVAPVDIGVDELADYVTIEDGEDGKPKSNPYARAEVFWPLPLCENRVEIIDSPGLNEAPKRELITLGYLDQADALVMVLMATAPVSMSEQIFLDVHVRGGGHHDAFFLFTRIDDVPEAERRDTVKSVRNRLSRYSTRENRVYFVNARGMLEGRIGQDRGLVEASGMVPFEAELERFLVNERGHVKVLVAGTEVEERPDRRAPEHRNPAGHAPAERDRAATRLRRAAGSAPAGGAATSADHEPGRHALAGHRRRGERTCPQVLPSDGQRH